MSCRHTQLSDASVFRLMIVRLILKSFNVADVNIIDNCITALVRLSLDSFLTRSPFLLLAENHFVMYSKTVLIWVFCCCCTVNSDGDCLTKHSSKGKFSSHYFVPFLWTDMLCL